METLKERIDLNRLCKFKVGDKVVKNTTAMGYVIRLESGVAKEILRGDILTIDSRGLENGIPCYGFKEERARDKVNANWLEVEENFEVMK